PDGSFVVAVVDTAEVWTYSTDGTPPRRLDDGGHDFCADPAVDPTGRVVSYQAWSVPDMPWDGAVRVSVEADGSNAEIWRPADGAVQQPRFASDGMPVHVHDGSGWLQVWWGDRRLVAGGDGSEHADASWGQGQASFAISPDGAQVAVARNERGFGRLSVVDVRTGVSRDVARGIHGQLSWRGPRLAAVRTGARTPTQIVVYETAGWDRRLVAVGPAAGWDGVPLVEPETVTLDQDGTTLHARWYRSPASTGRLLVMLHGGPTGQWPVTFMPRVALWLQRGWDVLLPDHRGSTGHGWAYQQALDGRWGELDVADTAAWIDHAHAVGWATPARTVVMGGSSGGYTVLRLLGRGDAAVAGGIALYPVTDLVDLAARSHRFEAHSTIRLIGPLDDVERYRERSAMSVVDGVSVPLLVLHGTADPVVPVKGTVAFVEALRARGGNVELHLFEGEAHGFRQPEHQLAEYRLIGEFLGRVTGSA
ncbi:MAG: prolyl oligopeptidase family serine peptidase, partial [Ilumatobacteraceae bacterium]